jgi:HEPN domain-containing protein
MGIARNELRRIARARLADAEALFQAGRYDGAAYLGGYVVEMALKARICRTLNWLEFPESRSEFEGLTSLRTHDLNVLLRLSNREVIIRGTRLAEWTIMETWSPEYRYFPVGTTGIAEARTMLDAATALLRTLA